MHIEHNLIKVGDENAKLNNYLICFIFSYIFKRFGYTNDNIIYNIIYFYTHNLLT